MQAKHTSDCEENMYTRAFNLHSPDILYFEHCKHLFDWNILGSTAVGVLLLKCGLFKQYTTSNTAHTVRHCNLVFT